MSKWQVITKYVGFLVVFDFSLKFYHRSLSLFQVVLEFGKHGGVGELLQNKLEQRKEETENWVSKSIFLI